jgi:hypothetical protein
MIVVSGAGSVARTYGSRSAALLDEYRYQVLTFLLFRSMLDKCVGDLQAAGVASAPSFLTPEGTFQLTTNSGIP